MYYVNSNKDKIPFNPATGALIDHTDQSNWMSYDKAASIAATHDCFTSVIITGGLWCLDIDKCITDDGLTEVARGLLGAVSGWPVYVEVSQSGTGLHVIGTYEGEFPLHRSKNTQLAIELYSSDRHITLGTPAPDSPVSHPEQLSTPSDGIFDWICENYFNVIGGPAGAVRLADWTTQPCEPWVNVGNDDAFKAMMSRKASGATAFGGALLPKDIFKISKEDWENQDKSSLDLSLLNHMAYYSRRNCDVMSSWYEQSNLHKWRQTESPCKLHRSTGRDSDGVKLSYIKRSILQACADCKDHWRPVESVAPAEVRDEATGAVIREGFQYLDPHAQLTQYFKGCYYIKGLDMVWSPVHGMIKIQVFRRLYGGYIFGLDSEGSKTTTSAENAFFENRGFETPTISGITFDPTREYGEIIDDMVNTYKKPNVVMEQGDCGPFLKHLQLMLPDEEDCRKLFYYFASMVQNQGTKFRWWPLLQGVEGNGKSILTNFLRYTIGKNYVVEIVGSKIVRRFNAAFENAILCVGEEVRLDEDGYEKVQTIITNNYLEIEKKGIDTYEVPNVMNGVLYTNLKDSVKLSSQKGYYSRKIAVFFTAQQSDADKIRDGMTTAYFHNLAAWADKGGYSHVAHLLSTVDIPREYDPVYVYEAPRTTAYSEWVESCRDEHEAILLDAIDREIQGYRAGVIFSDRVSMLLKTSKKKVGLAIKNAGYIETGRCRLEDGSSVRYYTVDGVERSQDDLKKLYYMV